MLKFKDLSLEDRDVYLDSFSNFPPYADLFFNNLFTWLSQKDKVEWATFKEALVLKFVDPFGSNSEPSYCFLAKNSAEDIINELLDTYHADSFLMLPEVTVANLKSSTLDKFTVTIDLDNSDYIYDANALAFMLGPKSKGFLRQVNYFLKNHSHEALTQNIDLTNTDDMERLVNAIHQWDTLYTHNDKERQESKALEAYIKEAPVLQPNCLVVVIDGKIEAFSLYAFPPQQQYVILSHAKSSYAYKGLFDFLIYCTVSRAIAEKGVQYVNFEQDLGLEGLRQHKQSMHPIKQLAKYTLIKN